MRCLALASAILVLLASTSVGAQLDTYPIGILCVEGPTDAGACLRWCEKRAASHVYRYARIGAQLVPQVISCRAYLAEVKREV